MKFSALTAMVLTLLAGNGIFSAASFARLLPEPMSHAQAAQVVAPDHDTVPRLLQFSATLKDAAARPLAGAASVTFALYAEQEGGTALWSEPQNVLADSNGHYSVLLGAATAAGIPAELFGTGQSRWLGVTVARHEEMPRVLLASVPYALRAADAETLGGLPASAYVTNESLAARITAPSSTTILTPQNSTAPAANANATNASSATTTAALPQATPTGVGTTNYVPLWTSTSALGNSLLYQTGGKIGVGTTTPTETLDVNGNSIFRGSFQLPAGHDATSASGFESHSFQFQASSYNSSTSASTTQSFGFRAEPLNNNTTNPSSQLDLFFIPNGGSEFINTGVSWSSTGIMTFAPGQTFAGASETLSNSLNLPNTTNGTTGVVNLGGLPIVNDYGSNTNIFVGQNAGGAFATSGGNNAALGAQALFSNQTGHDNVAVGNQALFDNSTGQENTAIGSQALNLNKNGFENTAVGYAALQSGVSSGDNVAVGAYALTASTGGLNVAVGFQAGVNMTTGGSNTVIGAEAQIPGAFFNSTAIGASSLAGASNVVVLGSIKNVNNAAVSAHVGIGITTPNFPLQVIDDGASGAGIEGFSNIAGDSAIMGISNPLTGDSNGGYFVSSSPNGSAVVGINGGGGYGAYFSTSSASTGSAIAAVTPNSAGLAGQFLGNVSVSGTLSKGAGNFKIDDPIDPGGKYLSHSFVESPDMMDIYNGNVVTNAKGYAVVTLPEWFEALNSDFRYQLTPVGQFSQAMIARKIKDRKFTIRTSRPHVEISWQVTGIRHDAYAVAHRIPTEEVKPPNEQGHYLHPELFGAGPEQGIGATAIASNAAAGSKNH
jgi:hypothetical protein